MSFIHSKVDKEIEQFSRLQEMVEAGFQRTFLMADDILESKINALEEMKKVDAYLKEYENLKTQVIESREATIMMKEKLAECTDEEAKPENGISAMFDAMLAEVRGKQRAITDTDKKSMITVENHITKLQHPERNNEDATLNDDELMITQDTECYKDPLTKCIIKNPLRNNKCNHYYEQDTIIKYISKTHRKCPYSGCVNILRKEDLVEDFDLKRKLAQR